MVVSGRKGLTRYLMAEFSVFSASMQCGGIATSVPPDGERSRGAREVGFENQVVSTFFSSVKIGDSVASFRSTSMVSSMFCFAASFLSVWVR